MRVVLYIVAKPADDTRIERIDILRAALDDDVLLLNVDHDGTSTWVLRLRAAGGARWRVRQWREM